MVNARDLIYELIQGELTDLVYVYNSSTKKHFLVKKAVVVDELVCLEIDEEIETYE